MANISKDELRKEIAAILKGADLASTSAKNVRQELEEKLECNLQSRRKEIDELVMEFVSGKDKKKAGSKKVSDDEEEEEEEEDEEEEEESEEEKKPAKRGAAGKKPVAKKAKKASDDSDASEPSDAESEEEYSPKKTKPIKTRKLPPKKKKGSESDSDEDWAKTKKTTGKKGGGGAGKGKGYTKSMTLSPELAALVGQESMARHEVVKKVWSIIKERELYDPNNKQFAICDDALLKVIGIKRFRIFGMMKYLKNHFLS
ncbi:PREDICTED: upstream activation factor subunit spp27 [Nicrophorus vespilloides]|uniref:Upstream activation factor subunit spp27 n=1 Tax=Nicrophorus vespilloides TaxID=110193 RepID=A0ABM1MWK2_NICVS|nr:PREDICTED: upstream activation factor subunit spp27 [Nicrophorus vespilloides]